MTIIYIYIYSLNYKPNLVLLKSPKDCEKQAIVEYNMMWKGVKEIKVARVFKTWTPKGNGPKV